MNIFKRNKRIFAKNYANKKHQVVKFSWKETIKKFITALISIGWAIGISIKFFGFIGSGKYPTHFAVFTFILFFIGCIAAAWWFISDVYYAIKFRNRL